MKYRIYNFDESGISTMITRGISDSDNLIPLLFIFPRFHFKNHVTVGDLEGNLGVTKKTGRINSSIFLAMMKYPRENTIF